MLSAVAFQLINKRNEVRVTIHHCSITDIWVNREVADLGEPGCHEYIGTTKLLLSQELGMKWLSLHVIK
jgi:hypothetical protein